MGYMRHHAILVTTWDEKRMAEAHEMAQSIFGGSAPVTEVVDGRVNGYKSFAILPDGSKEGWDESNKGDEAREDFLRYLQREHSGDDEGSPWCYFDWVELQFGDDEGYNMVLRTDDDPVLHYDKDSVL